MRVLLLSFSVNFCFSFLVYGFSIIKSCLRREPFLSLKIKLQGRIESSSEYTILLECLLLEFVLFLGDEHDEMLMHLLKLAL